jgi:DNA sulfur modification protein DndC
VTQKSDAPSCGTSSPRFGCWTCTVVAKDRSLEGFIEAGFSQFEPFIRFRDWLAQIRDEPGRRMLRRRNGRVTHLDNGSLVHGPFTMATRREVLERLLDLQREVGSVLVTEGEIEIIRRIWADDVAAGIERSVRERDQAKAE